MAKGKEKEVRKTHIVYYEWDNNALKYRVWSNKNPSDMFDFMEKEYLPTFELGMRIAGIPLIEGMPE
jgi:hypothetical protein